MIRYVVQNQDLDFKRFIAWFFFLLYSVSEGSLGWLFILLILLGLLTITV